VTVPERRERLEANLRLLAAFRALQMTLFPVAIVTLFWRDELGLSMAEILLLQALFGLFTAILEFPGGYVSDRLGYRRALAGAVACSLLGWLLQGLAVGFWSVLVAELALAFSLSLSSGTDAALLYESLLELGREDEFARWFGRTRSFGAASEGTAALLVGVIYALAPRLPFFVQMTVWIANGWIVWRLTEPVRERGRAHETWGHVQTLLAYALRTRVLRAAIASGLVLALSTFVPVWIIAIYAENAGVPVPWIGPIWAAANYAVALGTWFSDRLGGLLGLVPALSGCAVAIGAGLLGLGATTAFYGFAFYFLVCLARGVNGPLLTHVQQRYIPSSDRASLLSLGSLLFRGGFFVLGPALGLALDRYGEHAVLAAAGAVSLPLCGAALAWLAAALRTEPDPGPGGAR